MDNIPVRLMKNRRYKLVPVDKIVVMNSRDREQDQFSENVRSIQDVGLLMPIIVNERFYKKTKKYELVAGEGRLIAHQKIGNKSIVAEIINCDRKKAYLLSLIENIARIPVGTMWFAREVERMHSAGMPSAEISKIVGKSESYINAYVKLARQGEERLIRGVEQGVFPIAFAIQVAESSKEHIQHILMDAFDSGIVNSNNLRRVRKVITSRTSNSDRESEQGASKSGGRRQKKYTVQQLRRDIAKVCREKESFVREASRKEQRLHSLVDGLKTVLADDSFMKLLVAEGLSEMPDLKSASIR